MGQKRPNASGLFDMSGNVWEWCWDLYGAYSAFPSTNPAGPSKGSSRVIRGGSWIGSASSLDVANRSSSDPLLRFQSTTGLRLVRTAE